MLHCETSEPASQRALEILFSLKRPVPLRMRNHVGKRGPAKSQHQPNTCQRGSWTIQALQGHQVTATAFTSSGDGTG